MKIGVFDSGVGGKSVANAIEKAMPELEVVFMNDAEHLPYGTKTNDEIYGFCRPVFDRLIEAGSDVIVVACNTVSTNLIKRLREELSVPLVAMEPMVKPAAEATKSGVIAVCATPRTLASERYDWLKQTYAAGIKVIEPDCSDWTSMIEAEAVDRQKIQGIIDNACDQGADVIVLGCTHYHWIEAMIKECARGRAEVIQPEQAIVRRLKTVIEDLPRPT
jgi:glutamate racemase